MALKRRMGRWIDDTIKIRSKREEEKEKGVVAWPNQAFSDMGLAWYDNDYLFVPVFDTTMVLKTPKMIECNGEVELNRLSRNNST